MVGLDPWPVGKRKRCDNFKQQKPCALYTQANLHSTQLSFEAEILRIVAGVLHIGYLAGKSCVANNSCLYHMASPKP